MKKIIIVFILFAQLSSIIGQVYTPFAMKDAIWVGRDFFVNNTTPMYNHWQVSITGQDTLINGIIYKKIDKKGIRNNITAIREKDKIIYLREDNKDTILYDFNIRLGDTLNGRFYGYSLNSRKVVVTSIDSLLVGSNYRKKYKLSVPSFGAFGELVEGMGCRCGFIPIFIQLDLAGYLDCHSTNDKVIFGSGTNGKCDLLMSNEDVSKRLSHVQIYPNPIVDISSLKIPDGMLTDRVIIFDVLGKLVKTYEVTDNTPQILKNDYSKGIYFVHILHQNHVIALSKFIVN